MGIEGIMLSEMSHTEKDKHCMSSRIYRIENKLIENEIRSVVTQRQSVGGGGIGERWSKSTNFQLQDE